MLRGPDPLSVGQGANLDRKRLFRAIESAGRRAAEYEQAALQERGYWQSLNISDANYPTEDHASQSRIRMLEANATVEHRRIIQLTQEVTDACR